jgi:hypothetical protein
VVAVHAIQNVPQSLEWSTPWLIGAMVLVLLDVAYRYLLLRINHHRQKDSSSDSSLLWSQWFAPSRGASLIFLPAWLLGALLTVVFAVFRVLALVWSTDHYFSP